MDPEETADRPLIRQEESVRRRYKLYTGPPRSGSCAGVQPVRFWRGNRWSGQGPTSTSTPEWAAWPHLGLLIALGFYRIVLLDLRAAFFWGTSPPR